MTLDPVARAIKKRLYVMRLARHACCVLGLSLTALATAQTSGGLSSRDQTPNGATSIQDLATPQGGQSNMQLPSGPPFPMRQPITAKLPPAGKAGEPPPPYQPGEFEKFVQGLVGASVPIQRFGAALMTPREQSSDAEGSPLVPAEYLLKPGDEVIVTLWGTVDADLRLVIDRSGRVTIPRVGPILVAGVTYAELPALISQRVTRVFRNTQVSVSLGQLRGLRIYVTGFVARPGAYSVGSLATVMQALLEAGGPSNAGSMRNIELRRGKERVAQLDLYQLLMKGERDSDRVLQADDVIHVGRVGTQVALIGSVHRPAVFELLPGETINDLLQMAGGLSAVADARRISVERLDERIAGRVTQLELPAALTSSPTSGDVMRAFSAVDVVAPSVRQNKRVRLEGEVARPGEHVLPPQSTVLDALAAAGGMTSAAYVFGTEFTRESVRSTQEDNYERAVRNMETDLARNSATQRASNADEAAAQSAREAANARLIASLRAIKPTGRVVLQIAPDSRELPALALEDGDRIYIPPRPSSVGVFGSVFNAGNYLYGESRNLGDYIGLAGGPTRGADDGSAFVVRANGSVFSARQGGGSTWAGGGGGGLQGLAAEPGDTVFVPEEPNKTTFVQNVKDWTQILYQFGLGAAALRLLGN
jgi:protein involved in polysaccharide export with SLBB domain